MGQRRPIYALLDRRQRMVTLVGSIPVSRNDFSPVRPPFRPPNGFAEQRIPMTMPTESATRRHTAYPPEEWVDRFGDHLIRYATARLPTRSAAEDVVQDTLVRAIDRFDTYTGDGTLKGWLVSILKRQIAQYYRDQAALRERPIGRELHWELADELFDDQGNWRKNIFHSPEKPDAPLVQSELWKIVLECLRQLPPKQAAAFTLSVLEGMEAPHVCRELDVSDVGLRARIYRARMSLARCVGNKWL